MLPDSKGFTCCGVLQPRADSVRDDAEEQRALGGTRWLPTLGQRPRGDSSAGAASFQGCNPGAQGHEEMRPTLPAACDSALETQEDLRTHFPITKHCKTPCKAVQCGCTQRNVTLFRATYIFSGMPYTRLAGHFTEVFMGLSYW